MNIDDLCPDGYQLFCVPNDPTFKDAHFSLVRGNWAEHWVMPGKLWTGLEIFDRMWLYTSIITAKENLDKKLTREA